MTTVRALLLIAAFALFPASVSAQHKPEFSLSINASEDTAWGRAGKAFASAVRYQSGGRIRVTNYFDGQLSKGQQTSEFKLLQDGVADFAIGSTINWSPQVKELNPIRAAVPVFTFLASGRSAGRRARSAHFQVD